MAGDAEAVAERRDEIIAAMANTCKPYFGDIGEMTYLQWLQRYVELAIGDGDSTADTAAPGSPWLADTWRDRFAEMLKRAEARLHPKDFGPIETLFNDEALLEQPQQAITALQGRYPDADTIKLHPADVPFFVQLCKTLGKPVNFVPVIDKDVRRWWRSDSLWQAHDARYAADQVCIIPGTQAVAGITKLDEPVGELLDRFEQASIDEVLASGAEPAAVVTRRQARGDVTGPLAVVLDAPDVLWAGRTAINPVHRIGEPGQVAGQPKPNCHTPVHGFAAGAVRRRDVTLSVPLSGTWIKIRFTLPACDGRRRHAGCHRRGCLERDARSAGDRRGCRRPRRRCPPWSTTPHTVTVDWDPEKVADHTGVTATFGAPLAPGLTRGARRAGRPLLARGVLRRSARPSPTRASRSSRVC